MTCNWFWGSHGCDLDPGHPLPRACGSQDDENGVCSEHDGSRVRYSHGDDDWSAWCPSEGFTM